MKNKIKILGIDTGKKGGLVIIDENSKIIDKIIMPVLDKEYDISKMIEFLTKHSDISMAVIEKVHAIFQVPAKTTFEMGKGYGIILALLYNFGIKFFEVTPKQWQKSIHTNCSAKKAKIKSLYVFKREYPQYIEDFKITEKGNPSKNIQDGLIDALLIAEYGRRKYL